MTENLIPILLLTIAFHEKGGQTLMRLARPAITTPLATQMVVKIELPSNAREYLWTMLHSTNMVVWDIAATNLSGLQSTNADIWITNKIGSEFWRFRRQMNTRQIFQVYE